MVSGFSGEGPGSLQRGAQGGLLRAPVGCSHQEESEDLGATLVA